MLKAGNASSHRQTPAATGADRDLCIHPAVDDVRQVIPVAGLLRGRVDGLVRPCGDGSDPHVSQPTGATADVVDVVRGPAGPALVRRTVGPGAGPTTDPGTAALPDRLRNGLERLSGLDLSGVRVHYNSDGPARLNALAFTQGQHIHVGPGQEGHLPHEGWHVVQQATRRIRPSLRAEGVGVNADRTLE